MSDLQRVTDAIALLVRHGGGDREAHHLAWVIDQALRTLVDGDEYDEIVDIWLDHLREALSRL